MENSSNLLITSKIFPAGALLIALILGPGCADEAKTFGPMVITNPIANTFELKHDDGREEILCLTGELPNLRTGQRVVIRAPARTNGKCHAFIGVKVLDEDYTLHQPPR